VGYDRNGRAVYRVNQPHWENVQEKLESLKSCDETQSVSSEDVSDVESVFQDPAGAELGPDEAVSFLLRRRLGCVT
jgi:hypothetical protein